MAGPHGRRRRTDLAHGSDFIVGFNAERWAQFLDCYQHSSPVDEGELASA